MLLVDWHGRCTLASRGALMLLAGLGSVALLISCGRLSTRCYNSRLIASVDAIRLDQRGRRAYR